MLKPGDKFGDYLVEETLGQGGMGAVFLIREPVSGARYAAKIMTPPKGEEEQEFRARFAREAEISMKVRHRNLIAVYDVGEDPETHLCYILMDYLDGGSVSERIKLEGRLSLREATGIIVQIASALERAHAAGVVHRDIKPDNIMFDAAGVPHLMDLGIAKFADDGAKTDPGVTTTGVMIGTPAYMAPEQVMDSRHVDARADIYSLGIVFWEMLAGRRPNADATMVELMAKAIHGEPIPDIRTVRDDVPAEMAEVIARMCAPKRDERIQSAKEVSWRCRSALGSANLKRGGEGRRKLDWKALWKPALVTFAGLGAAALAFALAFMWGRRAGMEPAEDFAPPAPLVIFKTNWVDQVVHVTNVVNWLKREEPPKPEEPSPEAPAPGIKLPETPPPPEKAEPLPEEPETPPPYALEAPKRGIYRYKKHFVGYDWQFLDRGGKLSVLSFNGRNRAVDVTVPDAQVLGPRLFMNCRELRRISLPSDLTEIGASAFENCSSLESLWLPPTVKTIGAHAFAGCKSLQNISLPNGLREVGMDAFAGCPRDLQVYVGRKNKFFYIDIDGIVRDRKRGRRIGIWRGEPKRSGNAGDRK